MEGYNFLSLQALPVFCALPEPARKSKDFLTSQSIKFRTTELRHPEVSRNVPFILLPRRKKNRVLWVWAISV
jgi:hypothetical protein